MNSESVIHLVRAHAELYDPSHPNHRDWEHITHLWRIIAQELGPTTAAEDVRRRWSHLRTNYIRERRKLQSIAISGDTSAIKTSWPYFDMLTFLDDSIDEWTIPLNGQQGYEYYEAEAIPVEGPSPDVPGDSTVQRISNEDIINAVRPYEELYDSNHPKHRNREHIAQVWKIVAGQLKTTAVEAKKKWSNLRSNYMREKRKLNIVYSNGTTPRITWPYFELLSFLETTGEWRTIESDSFPQSYESDSLSVDYPTEDIIIKSENEVEEIENFPRRKRKATDCAGIAISEGVLDAEGIVDTEGMCLEEKPDNEDPDFMFLRSLLPMMKMLGPIENLEFKGEVIELLKRKVQQMPSTSSVQIHY